MKTASVIERSIPSRTKLFDIHPLFQQDRINLLDQDLFPKGNNVNMEKYPYAIFHRIVNPYMDNEVRGFIQHLAFDEQYTAATIHEYITCFSHSLSAFMNSKYPEIDSIADIDFEAVYREYIEFLNDKGVVTVSHSVTHVTEEMEWKTYSAKTNHLVGFVKFYRYVCSIRFVDDEKEYDKDVWDIRRLGIPFSTAASRPRYTVNYKKISQPWLKAAAKEYNYYRIQNRTMSAVLDDMKAFNRFSEFLRIHHPQLTGLDELDRGIIEDYYAFLSQFGYAASAYNRRIGGIRTLLIIGSMLELDRFPTKPLIMYADYHKVPQKMPKYFTDNELRQMNDHISELPLRIGRMLFVLENCGMRLSDICGSPISIDGKPCLVKNRDNEYLFTYYMPKCHRYNTIPVSEVVGAVIESAIADSQKEFGPDCKYIFAMSKDRATSVDNFSVHMNQMSMRNHLIRDDGSPLRIKGHTFRGTVATRYANCGISMDVIRMMLGQQKLGVLAHYVTIHGTTMVECMRSITDENERLIRNIGKENAELYDEIIEPALLPLPNGRCGKDVQTGICDHANSCYSCSMFRPLPQCMDIYRVNLREAENNIAIAELHGYERILQINTEIRDNLYRIITELNDYTRKKGQQ